MKIAYFTDTYLPQINGVTNTLSKLTAYLDNKEELSYKIFAPDFNEPSSEHHHENVERFYSFKFFAYPECRLSIPNFIKLYAALDAFKPDIIHSVTEINMGLAGIKYAMDRKIPLITTFTTNFPEYMKFYNVPFLYDLSWHMMRKVHNQSQLCLCPSNETKKLLESNGVKNVGLWGRGIDYEKFKPLEDKNEVKARYGISGKIMLLYVGRVSNEKNIDLLILAYQQLKKIYGEKLALVIVGGGPRLDDLTKKNPDIIFTGYLKNKELTDLYGGADIFSFPSSTETLGNVVLEAMASGIPVVGPSAGGLKDNIIDGYNGIMVEPNHLESFFQGIKTLIDEDEKRIFMSQNARKYAETKSWTHVFDHLILHYTNLLEQFKLSDIA
jgi:glycosyltransferase involved in cell wall biosynthesis